MVTMQTADNALKSFYLNVVAEQLNLSINPLLATIKQTQSDVWGKDIRKLVRYGVNGGIGAGTEEGSLPSASGNQYAQFVTTLKNLYGTIEISDKAIRSSTNNEGAFVNLLNDEMDGLVKSSSFNFGRMLFGDGSGTLATVASITDGVITISSVKNIAEGMIVDFISASGASLVAGRKVESVDRVNKKITISGTAITVTAVPVNSKIVLQNSYNLELTGLGAIFSSSTALYGVNRSQNPWLNPYSQSSVGAISETKIQKAIDYLDEIAGSKVNFIVCSWGVRRALMEHFNTYKRMVDMMEIKGGTKAISFNGIPVVADRFCPDGTMYLLNTDDFCLHQLCDWEWLQGEDGKILKQVAGKPVYTATLVKYADLLCSRPCGQAVLTGITEA